MSDLSAREPAPPEATATVETALPVAAPGAPLSLRPGALAPAAPPLEPGHILALQRTAGNVAVGRYLARLRDVPEPGFLADPGLAQPPAALAPTGDDAVVPAAVEVLNTALESLAGKPELHAQWRSVMEQVRNPKPQPPTKSAPPGLYEADVVDALKALTPDKSNLANGETIEKVSLRRKQAVLQQVFEHARTARDAVLAGGQAPAEDVANEWNTTLKDIHGFFATASLEYYLTVRNALLAKFGALKDGTAAALARVVGYYTTQIDRRGFLGSRESPYHKQMGAALANAEALIPRPWPKLSSAYGLNIRPNANNKLALSEHSFGFAIDITVTPTRARTSTSQPT